MMQYKPSLRDVAKRAGVSLGTASNVLNDRGNVSEEARTAVIAAAAVLGYRLKTRISPESTSGLSVIGAIGKINDGELMAINPFYSHVLAGIERECQRYNMSLMFANIEVDKLNRPVNLPPMLSDKQIDGILMVGTFLQDTIQLIGNKIDKPLVLVDAYAPNGNFDSVLTDNINGAYRAVEYLIKQGHHKIGLIGSSANAYPSIRERRKGYLRALQYHKIPQTFIEDGLLNQSSAHRTTLALLTRTPDITAIFACNDEAAHGVYLAAKDLGRRIPQDLSVIGFDGTDLGLRMSPLLTTMHVDKNLLGSLAVHYLNERAENPERPVLTTLISTELITRGSVRNLR